MGNKKNGKKAAREGAPTVKKNPAGSDSTEVSLYRSAPFILKIGLKGISYFVANPYIREFAKLVSEKDLHSHPWGTEIQLPEIDEDVGHILVHFLYTGRYQALSLSTVQGTTAEYKRCLQVYCVARTYELNGLVVHTREKMSTFEAKLSIFEILGISVDIYPKFPAEETWFFEHLQGKIMEAFKKDQGLFTDRRFLECTGKIDAFDKVLDQAITHAYSSVIPETWFFKHLQGKIVEAFKKNQCLFTNERFLECVGKIDAFDKILDQAIAQAYSSTIPETARKTEQVSSAAPQPTSAAKVPAALEAETSASFKSISKSMLDPTESEFESEQILKTAQLKETDRNSNGGLCDWGLSKTCKGNKISKKQQNEMRRMKRENEKLNGGSVVNISQLNQIDQVSLLPDHEPWTKIAAEPNTDASFESSLTLESQPMAVFRSELELEEQMQKAEAYEDATGCKEDDERRKSLETLNLQPVGAGHDDDEYEKIDKILIN
ncbi:hypothetical protein AOQ84DRAFT_36487 [Glonium stellatum]|uniref:BTB domain-containing protein n=1 Tax=Glonium stellatum TaxID=574774 RepID=A0A8E2F158_9PEZI|nr:hypothetical protein AOQ84DRAFT_36487 [Glonium stellatum]